MGTVNVNGITYTIEESFDDILLIAEGGQDLIIENGRADIRHEAIMECRYRVNGPDEWDFDEDEVTDWIAQYLPDFVSENFERAKPFNP